MAWKKGGYNKKGKKSKPKAGARVRITRPKAQKITVNSVKNIVNSMIKKKCEKKEYNVYAAGLVASQMWATGAGAIPSSGHWMSSGLTPSPLNGYTDTSRVGDEIHVTGMRNVFQFYHQANTVVGIKGKIILFTPNSTVSAQTATIDKLFNPNPIIYAGNGANFPVVYDTMCSRNMDYIREFNILRTVNFYVPPDPSTAAQKLIKTVNVGVKFKKPHVMRWDTAGNLSHGQIWAIVLAESGNGSGYVPLTTSLTGIPISDTLSGLYFHYYSKSYFIDP